ncbi:MAG: DUF952 domain-containing protein [Terrimonas sp.]|nr:DUF952 domain-containing protein [Terrimonas sp.]
MAIIYHITTQTEWEQAVRNGFYASPSLKEEGFIHCSQDEQVAKTQQRYFSGKTDLVKLVIDTDKLKSKYIFEWSPSTEDTFPHIYGPVNLEAVLKAEPI